MSDKQRDPNEPVQLKFRCREELRAKLENSARMRDTSINSEMIRILEKSYNDEDQYGGWKTKRLCDEISKAIRFFGVDRPANEAPILRSVLTGAFVGILNERLSGWDGLMGAPSAEPRTSNELVGADPEIEKRSFERGLALGHQITLAARNLDEERAQGSALPHGEAAGETLLQSAVRLGLMDPAPEETADQGAPNTKKSKKQRI